ncbi:hypothetical protein QQP08_007192 [Theobroma cacao]|uniref:Uncharacterized protein n=1 Tax=Theobroma cacao TaxID=3641 RepID=A0A061EBB8_THECC|nr:Uncharacterized protein TCM_011726 [Theobroma cacao]WRX14705.1 hypothetical protein QQP08_007192 [Theobroma cacao]
MVFDFQMVESSLGNPTYGREVYPGVGWEASSMADVLAKFGVHRSEMFSIHGGELLASLSSFGYFSLLLVFGALGIF